MRHVTDGELHAYLDSALDLLKGGLGVDRGDEVRVHLGSCSVCQERLQEEERVRSQAQSYLQDSAPQELALPSFEELRIRAEAAEGREGQAAAGSLAGEPQRYRGPLKGSSLAWAATIVLALGVGWMGGEVWRSGPAASIRESYFPETLAEQASEAVAEPGSETVAEPGSETVAEPGSETVAEPGSETVAEPGSGTLAESPSETVARLVLAPPVVGGVAEDRMDEVVRIEAEAPASKGAGVTGMDPARALLTSPVLMPQALLGAAGVVVQENSLAVPGLEVLSVEWEEWVPGERSLHIRQLLPMGDTLELRYLGMLMGVDVEPSKAPAVAPSAELREGSGFSDALTHLPQGMEASLPPGWNQVVLKKNRGWLVARAPLSEEYLRALLRSLR